MIIKALMKKIHVFFQKNFIVSVKIIIANLNFNKNNDCLQVKSEEKKMTFTPANISTYCQLYPTLPTCQSSILTFMSFLVQNISHSYDTSFTDSSSKACDNHREYYDFIVVGAGTAGCVVANRLSEIRKWKILLLEAGNEEPTISDVPGFSKFFVGSSHDWKYQSEPEPIACADDPNHRCSLTRGKMMGGSSSLNNMAYVRGNKEDYDEWARLGNFGWSYDNVLPYFLKAESNFDFRDSHATTYDKNSRTIVDAWQELGFHEIDYNPRRQLGVCHYRTTIVNGARQSSNGAFIRPIRGRRRNLVVKSNARVTKIIVDAESKTAIGVEYSVTDDDRENLRTVYARKEVILSAGVFESPKLLMLSGIGCADEMKKSGIQVVQDLPVGDNLHGHVSMPAFVGIFDDNTSSTMVSPAEMKNDAVYWLSSRGGPLSMITGPQNIVAFSQTLYEQKIHVPDVQYQFFNAIRENIEISKKYNLADYYPMTYYNAFVLVPTLLNPTSRGTVRLNITNSTWSQPVIKLNALTDPQDLRTIVNGAIMAKKLFRTRAFYRRNVQKYEKPADRCKKFRFESSRYFECVAKCYTIISMDFVGTCKMGSANDSTTVVDSRLKVKGVKRLRVIDASIMPIVPRGDTYASTIMIGEKGSDMIKDDWLE